MKMRNFITSYFAIIVMIIFLQHHLVASLSPIQQKTALFQFKQSLNISTPTICDYYSYPDSYEIPSHPKTMNWSMSSDYCTWEGVSCNQLKGPIPVGPQFNTFENDSYVGNLGLCGRPLSKQCEHDFKTKKGDECDIAAQEEDDDDYFFSGFTWEAVVIGYGCGVVPAFIIGYFMLVAGKPKWFAGIIARELGLKIRRMEIKWR